MSQSNGLVRKKRPQGKRVIGHYNANEKLAAEEAKAERERLKLEARANAPRKIVIDKTAPGARRKWL